MFVSCCYVMSSFLGQLLKDTKVSLTFFGDFVTGLNFRSQLIF